MESIKDFVLESITKPSNELKKISLGKLSAIEIEILKEKLGLDLNDYHRIMDNYAIKHTFRKHGNPKSELLRGQIAIQNSDFELIPLILSLPDKIEHGGKNNIGREVILTSKEIHQQVYFLVEEIRVNRKELALQTLYCRIVKQKPTP